MAWVPALLSAVGLATDFSSLGTSDGGRFGGREGRLLTRAVRWGAVLGGGERRERERSWRGWRP